MVKSSLNASFRSFLLRGLSALVLLVVPLSADLLAQSSRSSRTVMVEGRVTDSQTGEPIPGAAVMLKATNTGVTTDIDGVFMLGINDPKAILVVSSLGYEQKELPVDGRNNIDIALDPDVESLEDVVVVGYGTQKKATVSGSLSTVEPTSLAKVTSMSLANTLAGSMPGMITRQTSGEPGYDGAVLNIRGLGTWVNSNPLVLVDGVERDLNLINTAEIESFSVLKDASATAVYGTRGANGVILINTKKGEIGKPKVTLRMEATQLHGLRFPDYINGYEFATLMNEACTVGGGITTVD